MKNENYNHFLSCFKLKHFIFLILLIIQGMACQSTQRIELSDSHEKVRIKEAKVILKNKYNDHQLSTLENDDQLASYMTQYLTLTYKKSEVELFVAELIQITEKYNLDPVLVLALIKTESQFNDRAVGAVGEIGLMQIKPDTAEWVCEKNNIKWKGQSELKKPTYNIQIGLLYLNELKNKFKNEANLYLNAYNTGPAKLYSMPAGARWLHPYYRRVSLNYLEIYRNLKSIKFQVAKN